MGKSSEFRVQLCRGGFSRRGFLAKGDKAPAAKAAPTKNASARWLVPFVLGFGLSLVASPAFANPSASEVFKSIQKNVGGQADDESGGGSGKGLAIVLACGAGLIMVMLAGSKIRARRAMPQVMHHPGKLMREVLKAVPLKPKEVKQLKLLAEASRRLHEAGGKDEGVENPLTLILCPSVLARTLKDRPANVDRAVIAGLLRKMGVGK
jgi:hypothetical protein